jgi:hypothetical protein
MMTVVAHAGKQFELQLEAVNQFVLVAPVHVRDDGGAIVTLTVSFSVHPFAVTVTIKSVAAVRLLVVGVAVVPPDAIDAPGDHE